MTREEAKHAAEVMLAYANGKKIQYFDNYKNEWVATGLALMETSWDWSKYRIAPNQEESKKKHYRSYTMKEFVEEMHKHDGFIVFNGFGDRDWYGDSIIFIDNDFIKLSDGSRHFFDDLCANFIWSDDETPCGKEVEE